MKRKNVLQFFLAVVFTMGFGFARGGAVSDSILSLSDVSDAIKTNYVSCMASFRQRSEKFGKSSEYMVAPGLFADKSRREIILDAYSTLVEKGDIAEFFMITASSGHDYESVFVTFAALGDVAKATKFIGILPGLQVDPSQNRFWSKGERVQISVRNEDGTETPIESFVFDTRTGKAVEPDGFVFLGGQWDPDGTNFIPDVYGPGSVVSSYNESLSVFDTPHMAAQGEVYEKLTVAKPGSVMTNGPVSIVIRPENREGFPERRVRDFRLSVCADGFGLNGQPPDPSLSKVMTIITGAAKQRQDAFVTIDWADDVPLSRIEAFCRILAPLDASGIVKIEPPPAGMPYYKAFLPQKEWKIRANRFSQPCELKISKGGKSAVLSVIDEVWKDENIKPDLKIRDIPGIVPESLAGALKENAPEGLPVLLVFADASDNFGSVSPYLKAAMPTHGNLYVFLEDRSESVD